jgi:mevalonate kinase
MTEPIPLHSYYSNGKLLLTSEYLILFGATALAIPVQYGQSMAVYSADARNTITWKASILNEPWFETELLLPDLTVLTNTDAEKAKYLQNCLFAVRAQNPNFLKNTGSFLVKTNLNYSQNWGLGSSSTFIANLALWAQVDPIKLHNEVSSGSGYDIACANAQSAIVFSLNNAIATWIPVDFFPPFHKNIYFVYSGKKQISESRVKEFRKNYKPDNADIAEASRLTDTFLGAKSLTELIQIIELHENLLSRVLKIPALKTQLFSDFTGAIKSLGAWGGDFFMAVSMQNEEAVKNYFRVKGFDTLIKFEELALKQN